MSENHHQHSLCHSQATQQQLTQEQSSQADHRTGQRETMEHLQSLDNLHAEIVDRLEQIAPWQALESEQLREEQATMQRQLDEIYLAERPERTMTQVARQADQEALDLFQQARTEEVERRQLLAKDVLRVQAEAASKLRAFIQRQPSFEGLPLAETKAYQATVKVAEERSDTMQERFNQQIEKLAQFYDLVETQVEKERQALEQAFQMPAGTKRQEAISVALYQQESAREERSDKADELFGHLCGRREAEQAAIAAQIRQAVANPVLDKKFSYHTKICEMWQEAVSAAQRTPNLDSTELARREYVNAMARFITRLTQENDMRAAKVRKIFEDSGFKFLRKQDGHLKRALPILNLPEIEQQIDMQRHADLLRISGQHLTLISDTANNGPQQALDASNLAWMIARDNMQMDINEKIAREVRRRLIEEYCNRQAQP